MTRLLGRTALATLVAGALLMASSPALAGPCVDVTSIGDWIGTSCDIGDKTYTLRSTDLAPTYEVSFSSLNNGVAFSFIGEGNIVGPADHFIEYSIQVNDPAFEIVEARLDSDVSLTQTAGDTTVTKAVSNEGGLLDTLLSTNGSGPVISVPLSDTFLIIRDTLHVNDQDQLNSFNNTITQARVPEPATLTLLGASLLGVGLASRRRHS